MPEAVGAISPDLLGAEVGSAKGIPAAPAGSTGRRAPSAPVFLDTNALLLPFRERFPLLAEIDRLAAGHRIAVPAPVRRELIHLAESRDPGVLAALEFADRFPVVEGPGTGDTAILSVARRARAWVVTADRELAARLHSAGLVTLVPRGRRRLTLRPPAPARPGDRTAGRPSPTAREFRVPSRSLRRPARRPT